MLDEFIILPFLFAIVAVIVAVKAMNEIGELRRRLDRMTPDRRSPRRREPSSARRRT